ncbi:MAG: lauroyl acyltransferase [Pseudomonadota bacterium]
MSEPSSAFNLGHWIQNAIFVALIGVLGRLPYGTRLNAMGWILSHVLGPLVGYRRRALENLAMIYPDKPEAERRAIARQALDGFGRLLMEHYSRKDFRQRIANSEITGPGLEAARKAKEEGRAIIFASGHWSNHEATRTALDLQGFQVGGLYNAMRNPYFNKHYVDSILSVSGPGFDRSREGIRDFMRFLKGGGHGFLLHDVYHQGGEWIDFLGKPAQTSFATAELGKRFDAVIIPYFNTRLADGEHFKIELLTPLAHEEPRAMMEKLTKLLEDKIAEEPGQWIWIHRRWKSTPT